MAPPQSINRMHPTSMGEAVGFLATFFSACAEVFVWPRFVTFAWYLANIHVIIRRDRGVRLVWSGGFASPSLGLLVSLLL